MSTLGGRPLRGQGDAVRYLDRALAVSYPPGTMLRGPARCSACGRPVELTLPVGAGTPPCGCGAGVLFYSPWVTAGFANPDVGAGPDAREGA